MDTISTEIVKNGLLLDLILLFKIHLHSKYSHDNFKKEICFEK